MRYLLPLRRKLVISFIGVFSPPGDQIWCYQEHGKEQKRNRSGYISPPHLFSGLKCEGRRKPRVDYAIDIHADAQKSDNGKSISAQLTLATRAECRACSSCDEKHAVFQSFRSKNLQPP